MLGHLFTRGQAGPAQGSSQTTAHKDKTRCRGGGLRPRSQGPHASAFTHLYAHVCSHTPALTAHSCTHLSSHIPTHRCICAHGARTYVHIHTCLHAHTLILTHRHVLISGSWLPFWRFKPPRATSLHEALLRTPIQPSRAQVMCPSSTSTWPAKLDASERVQDDLQALGGGQGCQESRRGQEGADHSLLPRPGVSGGRITDGQRPCGGIRKHTHWETALGRGTPRKGILVAVGFGVKYHAGWEFSI